MEREYYTEPQQMKYRPIAGRVNVRERLSRSRGNFHLNRDLNNNFRH